MQKYILASIAVLVFAYGSGTAFAPEDTDAQVYNPDTLYDPADTFDLSSQDDAFLPILDAAPDEFYIVKKMHYVIGYSAANTSALWVAYELTRDELQKKVKRSDNFHTDPILRDNGIAAVSNNIYRGSGFDRGHLAPAADMRFSAKAMHDSFSMINIVPQFPEFNRRQWRELEEHIRSLVDAYGTGYVVTGLAHDATVSMQVLASVPVPTIFYKTVYFPSVQRIYAYLIPHLQRITDYADYVSSVDSIESALQIDLYSQLPDALESALEAVSGIFGVF